MQELAQRPGLTALAGLIASFPVPKIFVSNAVPLLKIMAENKAAKQKALNDGDSSVDDDDDDSIDITMDLEPLPAAHAAAPKERRHRGRSTVAVPTTTAVPGRSVTEVSREPNYREAQEYVRQVMHPQAPTYNLTIRVPRSEKSLNRHHRSRNMHQKGVRVARGRAAAQEGERASRAKPVVRRVLSRPASKVTEGPKNFTEVIYDETSASELESELESHVSSASDVSESENSADGASLEDEGLSEESELSENSSESDDGLFNESDSGYSSGFESGEEQESQPVARALKAAVGAIPRVRRVYHRRLRQVSYDESNPGHVALVLAALATGKDISNECYKHLVKTFGTETDLDRAVKQLKELGIDNAPA